MKSRVKRGVELAAFFLGIILIAGFYLWISPADSSFRYSWEESFSESRFKDDFHKISSIEIKYQVKSDSTITYRFYKIEKFNGMYYSNTGRSVDPRAVHALAESFTDFYESEYQHSYKDFFLPDCHPHLSVVITLANNHQIILKSDSCYHCFIPWNILYQEKTYTQYNGKIPSALLKILIAIDAEYWSTYDKEARWGCYPAIVPEGLSHMLSDDFPASKPAPSAAEIQGADHLLWSIDLINSALSPPVYAAGSVFVAVSDRLISLDAENGHVLWEFQFEQVGKEGQYNSVKNVLFHEGHVYIGAPDSWLYCFDGKTGNMLWKYETAAPYSFSLHIVGDNLLTFTGGVTCLDKETGEIVWEITDDTWNEKVCNDKILLACLGETGDSYYMLLESNSGEILWKESLFEVENPVYCNGVLYFSKPKEGVFASIEIETSKEVWLYLNEKRLGYFEVFEDVVLLLLFDENEKILDSVAIFKKGSNLLEYVYTEKIPWNRGFKADFDVSEDRIFLLREGGFIEAFSMENGERLWEKEVRGTSIAWFQVFKNVYVAANDGKIYCLNTETGGIIWVFTAQNALSSFPEDPHLHVSLIKDGFIFVVTSEGNLYALRTGIDQSILLMQNQTFFLLKYK